MGRVLGRKREGREMKQNCVTRDELRYNIQLNPYRIISLLVYLEKYISDTFKHYVFNLRKDE